MAKFLQDLLCAHSPLFASAMQKLEQAAGKEGVDVRLIGDIITRAHAVMRTIGLDPADTTKQELYSGLLAHAHDDALFAETDFVGLVFDGDVVSFHQQDVQDNVGVAFDDRSTGHLQQALQHELVRRYSFHERTDDRAVEQFARDAGLKVWYSIVKHNHKQTEETDTMSDKPYMLAIGDIFTDAFIKLNDETSKVTKDEDGRQWLSVEFGAKMPYDYVDNVRSVGPSPNAAVSFSRLGLRAGLMTYLGDDEVGKESLEYLAEQQVDTSTVVPEVGATSSFWYVLRRGADRTMLVKNEEYNYTWNEPTEVPEWIYLSQISPRAWNIHEALLEYLEKHPEVKLAFQPGTSHFSWGTEKLRAIYKRSHIVIMNREEAVDVTGESYDSLRAIANAFHEMGPKIAVITDGPNGSYASYDGKLVTVPNYPDPAPAYDRTGAGDAFASTIVAALAMGESMDTAMTWAPINSAYVVQHIGAQKGLLHREELQQYLADAPDWYTVSELND